MPVRAVVFDCDGLMFNTEDVFEITLRDFLARRRLPLTDAIRDGMIGRRPPEALQHLMATARLSEPVESVRDELRQSFMDILDLHLKPMPALFDLLGHLESKGVPKAVATSSPRRHLEHLLTRYALGERFHALLTAEDVVRGKPAPDVYLKAAETLKVAPSEMLVFEDSEAGTKAAAAAGAVVVAVPHRHTARHDFSAATHVAASLGDPLVYRLLS